MSQHQNVKKVVVNANDAPFVVEVDTGIMLQVEPDQSASIYFPDLAAANVTITSATDPPAAETGIVKTALALVVLTGVVGLGGYWGWRTALNK